MRWYLPGAMLLVFTLGLRAENLCMNGDFEDGLTHWNVPTWGDGEKGTPSLETKDLPDAGKQALRMDIKAGVLSSVYQDMKYPAGTKKVRLTCRIRTQFCQRAWATVSVVDSNGKNVCGVATEAALAETPWTLYTAEGDIPEGAKALRIYCSVAKKAIGDFVLFDTIRVEPVDENEPPPEVPKAAPEVAWQGAPAGGVNIAEPNFYPGYGTRVENSGNAFTLIPTGSGGKLSASCEMDSVRLPLDGPHRLAFDATAPVAMRVVLQGAYESGNKTQDLTVPAVSQGSDGLYHYSLEWNAPAKTGYCILKVSSDKKCTVRNFSLMRTVPETGSFELYRVTTSGQQGILAPDEKAVIRYEFLNGTNAVQTVSLSGAISDYFGKETGKFSREAKIPPHAITPVEIALSNTGNTGFYAVNTLWKHGNLEQKHCYSLVRVDSVPVKPDKLFGMSCFCGGAENNPAMRLMGVGTRGVEFARLSMERADGTIDYAYTDHLVQANEANHIETIGMVHAFILSREFPAFADEVARRRQAGEYPWSDAYFDAYTDFSEKLAAHYKDRIRHWSISGEINLLIRNNPENREYFLKAVRATAKGLRKGNPDCVISSISCSGADGRAQPRFPLTRELWAELSDVLDGISPDLYANPSTFGPGRQPHNSEDDQLADKINALRELMKPAGKGFMSIDERGPNINHNLPVDSPYSRSMANIEARNHVIMKSIPDLSFNLYFRWCPWREGEIEEYSLFRRTAPRHTIAAYANVARRLNQAKIFAVHPLQKSVPCYIFTRGSVTVAALWYSSQDPAQEIQATFADLPEVVCFDAQGKRFVPEKVAGKSVFTLGEAPVFMETAAAPEVLQAALDQGKLTAPELSGFVQYRTRNSWLLILENLTGKELPVEVEESGKKLSKSLPPGMFTWEIPARPNAKTIKITTRNGGLYPLPVPAAPVGIPKVADFAALEKRPALINLDSLSQLNDVDCAANRLWESPQDLSVEIRMGYNAQELLMSVLVHDDKHINQEPAPTVWRSDAIQFAFDPNHDGMQKKLNGKRGFFDDDWLFSAALCKDGAVLYCHNAPDAAYAGQRFKPEPEILRDEAKKTTLFRMRFPFAVFKNLTADGHCFGFNLIALDADRNESADYWIQLSPGIAGGAAPEKFQAFFLK